MIKLQSCSLNKKPDLFHLVEAKTSGRGIGISNVFGFKSPAFKKTYPLISGLLGIIDSKTSIKSYFLALRKKRPI